MTLHEFDIRFIGWPHLPYVHGQMFSVAGFNRRGSSSTPRRAEYVPTKPSDIVYILLTTNDGRGGRPSGLCGVLPVYQPQPGSAGEGGGGISNENLFVRTTVIHTLIALCA